MASQAGRGSEGERTAMPILEAVLPSPGGCLKTLLQVPAPEVSDSDSFLKVLEKARSCPSFSPSFLEQY